MRSGDKFEDEVLLEEGYARKPESSTQKDVRTSVTEELVRSERSYANSEMDVYELGEDVYSLIFISRIGSYEFFFSIYIISLKLALFSFLALDLHERSGGQLKKAENLIRITQFFLLPVAIAMQEDLIHVYTRIANIKYSKDILASSIHATEWKFGLSFLLRFIDGMYSLIVNFVLLLVTDEVLSLFLNFAALQFLQSIDDVAFDLAKSGYLGDRMEESCQVVKECTLPRRRGDRFTNSLDTVLYLTTYSIMLVIYIYAIKAGNGDESWNIFEFKDDN